MAPTRKGVGHLKELHTLENDGVYTVMEIEGDKARSLFSGTQSEATAFIKGSVYAFMRIRMETGWRPEDDGAEDDEP